MWARLGILATVGLLLGASCSNKPEEPENLLNENTYVNLMVELQLVRTYSEAADLDSLATDSLAQEIYTKYGTSREQFYKSHRYFQQFPKDQKERLDKAIELLRMDQVEDTTESEPPPEELN